MRRQDIILIDYELLNQQICSALDNTLIYLFRGSNDFLPNLKNANGVSKCFAECIGSLENINLSETITFYSSNRKSNFDQLSEFSNSNYDAVLKSISEIKFYLSGWNGIYFSMVK